MILESMNKCYLINDLLTSLKYCFALKFTYSKMILLESHDKIAVQIYCYSIFM